MYDNVKIVGVRQNSKNKNCLKDKIKKLRNSYKKIC